MDALGSLLLRLRRVLPGLDGRVGAPRADELTQATAMPSRMP